jgi:hypothetical protein
VGIPGKLELLALGASAKGGLDTFPIYIVKRRCIPVLIQEWIMTFGFLDQSFAKARSRGCGGDIIILFLGNQFSVVQ